MKTNKYLLGAMCVLSLSLLPGCSANMANKNNADAMRIWISPAYRSDVKVNQQGHMYVMVNR